MLKPMRKMSERVDVARGESEVVLFYDLMKLGDLVIKIATAGLIAAVADDRERHRYRLLYSLVRANGVGDWSSAAEAKTKPPFVDLLTPAATEERNQLTQKCKAGSWQHEALSRLDECFADLSISQPQGQSTGLQWLKNFATLRNKTLGHVRPQGVEARRGASRCRRSCPATRRPNAGRRGPLSKPAFASALTVPRKPRRTGRLRKSSRASTVVRGGWEAGPASTVSPARTLTRKPRFPAPGAFVVRVRWETEPMAWRASPRKPKDSTRARSSAGSCSSRARRPRVRRLRRPSRGRRPEPGSRISRRLRCPPRYAKRRRLKRSPPAPSRRSPGARCPRRPRSCAPPPPATGAPCRRQPRTPPSPRRRAGGRGSRR